MYEEFFSTQYFAKHNNFFNLNEMNTIFLQRTLLTWIFFLFLPTFFFAQQFQLPAQSPYLTYRDTVFISLDDKTNEKIYEHTIIRGQTLYSLARFFGLNEEQLYPYNPTLNNKTIRVGQKVRIPLPNLAIKRFKKADFQRTQFAPVLFKVHRGDNLFKISKTLFHMPIDSILKWNGLVSQEQIIAPGQVLHVGWLSVKGVPDSIRAVKKTIINLRSETLHGSFVHQKHAIEQRGAAFWQIKGNAFTDLYCLHRTARVGSIVEVLNMMNNKMIYAKVIGTIPTNAFHKDVVVIVSPSVAKLLDAKDAKFFVRIKFKG